MPGKREIVINAEKCTGCRLCMLACSWANEKTHWPQASLIRVDVDEKRFVRRIFLNREKCTGCLSCVNYCPGGALSAANGQGEQAIRGA